MMSKNHASPRPLPDSSRERADRLRERCAACQLHPGGARTAHLADRRQIAKLETWLSARLFERSRTGATPTDAGVRFRDGVAAGLAAIHRGAAEVAELSSAKQVVIACSHDASHLLIMPRYDALRQALGEDVQIRILTYHHYIQSLSAGPSADIRLTWDAADSAPEDRVVALREAVRPVCSPAYAAEHAQTLAGPVAGLGGLTFLDLLRPSERWARWEDWFAVTGSWRAGRARRRVRRIRPRLLRSAHRQGASQVARAQMPRVLRPVRIAWPAACTDTVVGARLVHYGLETGFAVGRPVIRLPPPRSERAR